MVIAIIAILAALLLPVVTKGKLRARQTQCASNLKQIGVAFHAFAHDHNSRYPMQVRTNEDGTLEFLVQGSTSLFRHFQALSNDLSEVSLLVCPSDRRASARSFDGLSNTNVSYALRPLSTYDDTQSILASDWNIIGGVNTSNRILWSQDVHQGRGNILYSDGHVEQLTSGSATYAGGFWTPGPAPGSGGGGSSGGGGGGGSPPPDPGGIPPPPIGGGGNGGGAPPAGGGSTPGSSAGGNTAVAGGSQQAPGLFSGVLSGGNNASAGPSPGRPGGGGSSGARGGPTGGGASSGGGVFSQMENAIGNRPSTGPQSTPAPQIAKTYTTPRTQDMVAPAILALAQTNVTRASPVMTNKPAPEPAVEASPILPDEAIPAVQAYIEPKGPGYAWPVFLILLLIVLTTELMRRHRGRRKRRRLAAM